MRLTADSGLFGSAFDSSLGDITTRAVADGEDALGRRFRIRGAKTRISAPDHDITLIR